MAHSFRFGIQSSRAASAEEWAAKARKIEDLGFSTLFIPDHFGDQFAPLIALASAAAATKTLRLGTLVLDNDFRHPVVLAKEIATLDVLSGGRVELGIGAGWMLTDYEVSGIPFEPPGKRIERLKESIAVLKGLFENGPFSYSGRHYQIEGYDGLPKPVQRPHPPLLVGGGGKRVLKLAAREADIVGVNFVLAEGAVNPKVAATGTSEATAEKIGWIKEAAGPRFGELELNVTVFFTSVTDDQQSMAERIAGGFGMPASDVLVSPHALIGSAEQIVDVLQRRREEHGFSYIVFSGDVFDTVAPVVRQLAGR